MKRKFFSAHAVLTALLAALILFCTCLGIYTLTGALESAPLIAGTESSNCIAVCEAEYEGFGAVCLAAQQASESEGNSPAGIPWWIPFVIVIGVLCIVVLVLYILHRKGVFQILNGKMVAAMRSKAAVDATIAAVKANKAAAEKKLTDEESRVQEFAIADAKNEEGYASALEARAAAIERRAQLLNANAANLRKRANALKADAAPTESEQADAEI